MSAGIDKPWYQSRGIIGGLVAVVAGFCSLFGFEVDQFQTTEILLSVGAIAGGVAAIIGRIKATRPIRMK